MSKGKTRSGLGFAAHSAGKGDSGSTLCERCSSSSLYDSDAIDIFHWDVVCGM